MFQFCQHKSKFNFEVSKLWLGFYMLTGGIICMFFVFYNFWRRLFFPLFDNKDYYVLCNMGYRKGAFFLLSFSLMLKILLLPIISLRFLFLLYAIIGFSWNVFFSLGLICNKCQCSSMIFLMFGKVLLNFSTSRMCTYIYINTTERKGDVFATQIKNILPTWPKWKRRIFILITHST